MDGQKELTKEEMKSNIKKKEKAYQKRRKKIEIERNKFDKSLKKIYEAFLPIRKLEEQKLIEEEI